MCIRDRHAQAPVQHSVFRHISLFVKHGQRLGVLRKKHLAAKPRHILDLAHQIISGHPLLLHPAKFSTLSGPDVENRRLARRAKAHARPAFPKARRNIQRPCGRLVKPVRIRAGALRQPQPFQPRHMKLPRVRMPGQNKARPALRQKLHSRGLVHKAQPEGLSLIHI